MILEERVYHEQREGGGGGGGGGRLHLRLTSRVCITVTIYGTEENRSGTTQFKIL